MKLPMIVAPALVALFGTGQVAAADGKAIYDKFCGACHNVLAPKLGDKAAWAPRIANGTDTLVATVIKGKGAMPPKGGAASLSDDAIKAAVEYMLSQVN